MARPWILTLETIVLVVFHYSIPAFTKFVDPHVVTTAPGSPLQIRKSPEQLQLPSTALVVIIPGTADYGTPETSIEDRYVCSKFTMEIEAVANVSNTVSIRVTPTAGFNKNPDCTIVWGDGTPDTSVDFRKLKRESVNDSMEHYYAKPGVYDLYMECEESRTTYRCPEQNDTISCMTTLDILDDFYNTFAQPMKFLTSATVQLESYMELSSSDCVPYIYWSVVQVNGSKMAQFTDFLQPNTSVLRIEKETLEPGEYVVFLEVSFPSDGPTIWMTDHIMIRVVLNELVAHIRGPDHRDVPYGVTFTIDASDSLDPAENVSSLALKPLVAYWRFANYPGVREYNVQFNLVNAYYPTSPIPGGGASKAVTPGSDYALEVNTALFPAHTMCIALFTLSRGDRVSTAMQTFRVLPNAVPLSITCVYNCLHGHRLFTKDDIQFDADVDSAVDVSTLAFSWSGHRLNETSGEYIGMGLASTTGLNAQSLEVTSNSVHETLIMSIQLDVIGPGFVWTKLGYFRRVNRLPYGGNCLLNSNAIISAHDWLTLTCAGWRGNDARPNVNVVADINPLLTYVVRQKTIGALVEEEPVLNTRSLRSHLILKVGAPPTYVATLTVYVTDILQNSATIVVPVISKPAFDVTSVTPTDAGAMLIRNYTQVVYPFDQTQLQNMGKSDLLISLVSGVCSNLHLVQLPVWTPPVPRVLNTDGAVLDLTPQGNTDVGSLSGALKDAEDGDVPDPATLAIQEVMHSMVVSVREIIEVDVAYRRKGDRYLASVVANAITNIGVKSQFINDTTKVDLVFLSEFLGIAALEDNESDTEDVSAQIAVTCGEVFYMARAVTNSIVPDTQTEVRLVEDLSSSRQQIEQMLDVIGGNMTIDSATLSDDERAYLYLKMQKSLVYKNRSKKKAAKEAGKMSIKLAKAVLDKIKLCHTCDNEGSTTTKQLVRKNNAQVLQTTSAWTETSQFRLDGVTGTLDNGADANNEWMAVSAFEFQENVFMYDEDETSSYITSSILRLDVKSSTKSVTPKYLTFDQNVISPDTVTYDPLELIDEEDASEFAYHKFIFGRSSDYTCMIVQPIGDVNFTAYSVYIGFTQSPSIVEYDFTFDVKKEDKWQRCVPPSRMKGHTGTLFFAISVEGERKNVKYNLTLVTGGCLTWNEAETKWHGDKCELEWIPRNGKITCFCYDIVDTTFGNSFLVAPNSIDFSRVFVRFSPLSQAAVLGAICGILVIYIVVVIFLAKRDREDKFKWAITPLRDNRILDDQFYLIKVFTGMRHGAGTSSRAAFVLTGANGSTGTRELFDGVRETFATGSIMTFLMATGKDLGHLEHLHIWHNNSGRGSMASWYLNQVTVYDVARKQTYTFCVERWLSVETAVYADATATSPECTVQFESRFFFQTRDRLSESHMWVSMWYRPSLSTFTRVQRASCALVYIFLTMIANAMFYNPSPNYESPPLVQAGPFRFTSQQVFISLVSALVTTPVVMLLIMLFKRTKRRPEGNSCGCIKAAFCRYLGNASCCRAAGSVKYEEALQAITLSEETPKISGKFHLPWWCIYFAWLLFAAGVVVPAFFVLLYSMEWGKQKSEEWMTAFLMSLLESVLLVDPLMVMCMAFLLACLVRSSKTNTTTLDVELIVDNYRKRTDCDNDYVRSTMQILKKLTEDHKSYDATPRHVEPPRQGEDLERAAKAHARRKERINTCKNVLSNLLFLFIVTIICYGSRDNRSYKHHEEMVNRIVTPRKLPHFHKIKTPGDVFSWISQTAIPGLFPTNDTNGDPLHWYYKQFVSNLEYFRLGPPRLRQLRVNKRTCSVPYYGNVDCYSEYDLVKQEDGDYCIGWQPTPCPENELVFRTSSDAWYFTSALDVWGLPVPAIYKTYSGGGYIAQFDISRSISETYINELYENLWLDRQTRAVFFEFTLYVPSTNMFIYHVFIVEFPESGGALTSFSIYPIRVYNHVGSLGTVVIMCEILFVIYWVFVFARICVRFYQQGFKQMAQFWQGFEIIMFMVGVAAIVIYAIKAGLTSHTISKYKEDIKVFVNFAHIVLWDHILVTLLATLVFMATIRVLEVMASSQKVSAVVAIFKRCGGDLFWYGLSFMHTLFAFAFIGFFLFGRYLKSYMTILESLTTLTLGLIGKNTFSDINSTQPIFAQVFFMLYVFTVVFFTLTIFLSILGSAIDGAMSDKTDNEREYIVEHLLKKLKAIIRRPHRKLHQMPETECSNVLISRLNNQLPRVLQLKDVHLISIPPYRTTYDDMKEEKSVNKKRLPRKRRNRPQHPVAASQ